jgi:hypothetical protein
LQRRHALPLAKLWRNLLDLSGIRLLCPVESYNCVCYLRPQVAAQHVIEHYNNPHYFSLDEQRNNQISTPPKILETLSRATAPKV